MSSKSIATLGKTDSTAWLRKALFDVQTKLKQTIRLATNSIKRVGTPVEINEEHWIALFRDYLPSRYEVAKGIVIDSLGNRSEHIDIVIFDRHHTPVLLDQQRHRYIPVESVYAVFECKPYFNKGNLSFAGCKAASVRKLHRTALPHVHAAGTSEDIRHFPILAGILADKSKWSDGLGESFKQNLAADIASSLDCGCALKHGAFDTFSGQLTIVPQDGALMYFLFQLLGKLQSLGTVPAIDWAAYAAIPRTGS
jgi:hypothetical protein